MKTRTITRRRRLAPTSYYDGKRTAGECSNHYIKMPATLAALAHPEIKGLYYVDLDSVARYPWTTSTRLREHENNFSDVSFHPLYGSKHMGSMRWQVSGNNYYARDSVKGRAFFASWFDNRCTFKDQYSLWHTILELAAAEGCVDYAGEIFSLTYSDTRGMGPTHKNYIKLDCDTIDARCPGFRYSNRGGATCDANTPHLLGDLHHRSIGTDGKDFPALRRMFGVMSGTTTACPRARRRVREVTGARHRRRDRPLVQVRQRALRAQSLDRHPARRRAAAVATVKRWPGQVRVPRDGQRQVGHHQKNEAWRREEEFGGAACCTSRWSSSRRSAAGRASPSSSARGGTG